MPRLTHRLHRSPCSPPPPLIVSPRPLPRSIHQMGSEFKKTTMSTHTTEVAEGTHAFKIFGYSLKKSIGVGNFVRSVTFPVSGYHWAIRFYPDGMNGYSRWSIAFSLELRSRDATARASYHLRLLKQDSGLPGLPFPMVEEPRVFSYADDVHSGVLILPDKLDLAELGYINDDSITVECTVKVIKESQQSETMGSSEIQVPPSDIAEHLGKLLETKMGGDVTFSVGEETFAAHRIVLAMRSPVFKAQLCGGMKEAMMSCITIEDVQPDVFRALLHFIYNDSLPEMLDLQGDDYSEMIRHLLVAADKYAMDRLKLLCQHILAKNLDVETVATTLAIADQHNCSKLKQVCIDFICTSNAMDAVMGTRGYVDLKRTCPYILIDVLEKTRKACKA